MNKIKIKRKTESKEIIIPMSEMKPGQIGQIVEIDGVPFSRERFSPTVRLVDSRYFFVEDLSGRGGWNMQSAMDNEIKVRLLPDAVLVVHLDGDGEE